MKLTSKLVAAGLLGGFLLVPQGAFAAAFANTAQSATSTALGGVGAANPDEPNSSYYNPAAMTARKDFNVYVGPTLIIPTVTYDGPNGQSSQTVSSVLPPPNLHIALPFANNMAAGVGVSIPYGLTIQWPKDWVGRDQVISQSLTAVDINPNFAYRFPTIPLSLSVGAQFIIASVELKNATILRSDKAVNADIGGSGFGAGATAAVFYQPLKQLSLGLTYRSAATLNFDGKAHFTGETGTPFESTFVDQPVSTSINLPHSIVAGIGYDLSKLFLEFDVGFTTWSNYKKVDLQFSRPCKTGDTGCTPGTDTNPPTNTIQAKYFDAPVFRLGAQYNITPNFPIRIGASYDMTPIPDETVSPALPDNNRAIVSVGTGYTWNHFRGDVGYQFVTTSRDITNGNQNGTYNTDAHVIGINIGYGY